MNFTNIVTAITSASPKESFLALLVGSLLGFLFAKLSLPIPAPPVLSGILGIVGIWLGFLIGK